MYTDIFIIIRIVLKVFTTYKETKGHSWYILKYYISLNSHVRMYIVIRLMYS